jgi:hypothetical protein
MVDVKWRLRETVSQKVFSRTLCGSFEVLFVGKIEKNLSRNLVDQLWFQPDSLLHQWPTKQIRYADKWDEETVVLSWLIKQRSTTVLPVRNVTGASRFFSTLEVMNFSIVLGSFYVYGIFHNFSYSDHTNIEIMRSNKITQKHKLPYPSQIIIL